MEKQQINLVWLRRDLRLYDHAALASALAQSGQIQPIFVLDTDILARFTNPSDRRLGFIARALCQIDAELKKRGGGLLVLHGSATQIIPKVYAALGASHIFASEDYEPSARARDAAVAKQVSLNLSKDHLIISPTEILKDDGTPYKVFTPYSKVWLSKLTPLFYAPYEVHDKGRYADFEKTKKAAMAAGLKVVDAAEGAAAMLAQIGYKYVDDALWPVEHASARLKQFAAKKIKAYATARDMVAEEGTSQLSPYLRFGLVSVRECMREAVAIGNGAGESTWIKELIWREFYAMILYHYPDSVQWEWNAAYRGTLGWSENMQHFEAWQEGKTGYPIVDAAMRQLLETGWMHNRARMIVASFLTKDLLVDWRKGEEHFAQYLMDYEQASNVGGWQWAASTGTDAQPWFRIFNPTLQSQKFDPRGDYIRRYVPELQNIKGDDIHEPWKLGMLSGYMTPIVDHAKARDAALAMFKRAAG
ncbi:MAG: cryptochrome/photolyase family protein [Alphaproteobacteria bacterium]